MPISDVSIMSARWSPASATRHGIAADNFCPSTPSTSALHIVSPAAISYDQILIDNLLEMNHAVDATEAIWKRAGKTTFNTWRGTSYTDSKKTFWLASVGSGLSYYDPVSGLTTRQLQVTSDMSAAVVSICRNSSMAETPATCNNGLDDDCDGFIDGADSDCGTTYPPPSPPPPPALAPPRTAGTLHSTPLYVGNAMSGHRALSTKIKASSYRDCVGIPL